LTRRRTRSAALLIASLGVLVALHHGSIMPMDHGSAMPGGHGHDGAGAMVAGAMMVCVGILAAGLAICPRLGTQRRLRPDRDLGIFAVRLLPAPMREVRSRAGPQLTEVLRL
jgi:hypothetical protein